MSPCSLDHLDNVREGTANRYERLSELLDWQKELRNPRLISVEEKKQRLGIARAIYKNASVIFADEPTASLDAHNRQIVIDLLRHRADQGAIVVLATHDPILVSACDQNYQVGNHN